MTMLHSTYMYSNSAIMHPHAMYVVYTYSWHNISSHPSTSAGTTVVTPLTFVGRLVGSVQVGAGSGAGVGAGAGVGVCWNSLDHTEQ